jgi:putative sterol carrier protein
VHEFHARLLSNGTAKIIDGELEETSAMAAGRCRACGRACSGLFLLLLYGFEDLVERG